MKYVICLKQVPDTKEIVSDPITGSLLRDTAGSIPNPYDDDALSAVLDLREKTGGTITAITMGPKQSRATLRNALSLGVDYAYQMQDSRFSGADVYVTAYTLSQGIKKIGMPDIIFCGKQSIDGDTGQVGAELAEIIGYSHIYYVTGIDEVSDKHIIVKSKIGNIIQKVNISLPAVISTEADVFPKKISSFRDKILSQKKEIKVFSLDDLEDNNQEHYGYRASPTKVKQMFVPNINRKCQIIDNINFDELIKTLQKDIQEEIKKEIMVKIGYSCNKSTNVFEEEIRLCVIIEENSSDGREIINNIIRFKERKNIIIDAIIVNSKNSKIVEETDYNMLDRLFIYNYNSDILTTEHYVCAISEYIEVDNKNRPDILLVPATPLGKSYAPRVAAKYKTGITADCTEIDISEDNLLIQIRPAFGDDLLAKIITPNSKPQMATIRPGVLEGKFSFSSENKCEIYKKSLVLENSRLKIISEEIINNTKEKLEDSEIVVIAGNAIKEKAELEIIEEFAKSLNAGLGVTRPLAQGGLASHNKQVGVSGVSLKSKIAILIGVSGSNQTLAGLKKVNKIIAINKDEKARIFSNADIGIVRDWKELINLMEEKNE